MTKRTRDLAKRGTGGVTGWSGQVTRLAGLMAPARSGSLAHRVVPAHLACRIGARPQAGERNAWPAVVSIALGSFALVFSEVIPVGLLADISGHLRVSIGTAGLMVVVPAVTAAAISSPPAGSVDLAPRAGPGSAGTAARRGRWSRKHRTTTTLTLPFAAMPAAARKELPCPATRKGECYAERGCDDRIRAA
jgi:hypothetical protein